MARKVRMLLRMLSVALVCFLVAACGGGGGGGGSSAGGGIGGGGTVPSAYKGVQTQASLDQRNAEEITLSAYAGGSLGTSLGEGSSAGIGGIFAGAVRQMNLGTPAARPLAATAIQKDGPCGGEVAGAIDGAIVGSFTGELYFADYCEGGARLNGNVGLTGSQNPAAGVVQVTYRFNGLSITSPDDAYRIDGSMVMNLKRNTPDVTGVEVDLVLTDEGTGKTEYLAYNLTSTRKGEYSENVLWGKYYTHDRGFVEFVTAAPVRVRAGEELPEGGTLRFTGAGGTWARLSFEDGFGFYRVDTSDGGYLPGNF